MYGEYSSTTSQYSTAQPHEGVHAPYVFVVRVDIFHFLFVRRCRVPAVPCFLFVRSNFRFSLSGATARGCVAWHPLERHEAVLGLRRAAVCFLFHWKGAPRGQP